MSLSGHINISLLIPNVYEQIIKYYHISQVAISDNIYVFKLICTFSSYWNITQVIRYSSPSSHEEEKKGLQFVPIVTFSILCNIISTSECI